MIERLIEHWLTNVNELGYQIPFCHVLLADGYELIHVSRHGRGEHGKDIIARNASGLLETFQLKGGDINLRVWREIRGEVEELVCLPVRRAGVSISEGHRPVLVTNGELIGDAGDNVRYFAEEWRNKGYGPLDVWNKDQVLKRFLDAHGSFLPTEMGDLRHFVELYVADHRDRLPRARYAAFLMDVAERYALGKQRTAVKRAVNSIALLGAYIAEQYERQENWVSAAEAWTIVASTILFIASRETLADAAYDGALGLAAAALDRNLERLEEEVWERPNFLEGRHILAEPLVHGNRTTTVLGWLCATALRRHATGREVNHKQMSRVIKRQARHLQLLGECDWPKVMAIAIYLDRFGPSREADRLIGIWLNAILARNVGKHPPGFHSPYWLEDKVLEELAGELPPYEKENFARNSYTSMAALDMLVRRLCRQRVRALWPRISRIHYCQFVPEHPADWFRWKSEGGATEIHDPHPKASWSDWRRDVAEVDRSAVPPLLVKHSEWLMPFALTYPHRVTRSMSALID